MSEQCNLHLYLYATADRLRRVRWRPIVWAKDLESDPDTITELANRIVESGLAQRQEEFLILNEWPACGSRKPPPLSKGEQFKESTEKTHLISPRFRDLIGSKVFNRSYSRLKVLEGIVWDGVEAEFKVFIDHFPAKQLYPTAIRDGWKMWARLTKYGERPSLQVILHTLKTHPPGPKAWAPSTWLKRRYWKEEKIPLKHICPVCLGERQIYGVQPDGIKGAVPCRDCDGTGVVKIDIEYANYLTRRRYARKLDARKRKEAAIESGGDDTDDRQ